MPRPLLAVALTVLVLSAPVRAGTRGADELYWTPTLEQALAMARHTGKATVW